jgi:uncharacterized caspase-like protein
LRILVAFLAVSAIAGVRPVPRDAARADAAVAPDESAALFVGVREFPDDDTLAEVRYAVDDAVDLAYVLAIDGKPRLVDPRKVVLALSGEPQKPESRERLQLLRAAGAQVQSARHADVLKLLRTQSNAVGVNGLLIVAFATHGISDKGTQYLLTASSLLRDRETAIPETKIREILEEANVPRALILLDACRQRLATNTRAGIPDPRSAAALMQTLGTLTGHVIFAAAAPGEYAYDDDTLRNGVFTAAVIDALRCNATHNGNGYVTVDTLSLYVEDRVLNWIRKHRNPRQRQATQLQSQGRSRSMPLAVCGASSTREAVLPLP